MRVTLTLLALLAALLAGCGTDSGVTVQLFRSTPGAAGCQVRTERILPRDGHVS